MKVRTSFFPLGASYYPPFHTPAEWEQDVANMAKAGMNAMRTAELLASWDYIEPRRGQFDFSWVDRIIELAQQHNIKVLLGTGSCCPPIWMTEEISDLQKVSREGVPYPTATVWDWVCTNNPRFRVEAERYLHVLMDRYGKHPMLLGWQIDNEIGHRDAFHKGKRYVSGNFDYFCYCENCANGFRGYVERKYKDIEALNHAWAWDPTHHRYYDWHQIQPPRSLPIEWGNGTAWLDYRTFQNDSQAEFIGWQNRLIKARDQEHPTMTNVVNILSREMGVQRANDHWKLAREVDVIGYDIYPRGRHRETPEWTSRFLDFAYSVARHTGQPLWLPEFESGPIGGFALGPLYTTKPIDIKRWNLEALAHGVKMILYQGYRDWNCIPLHWGALADFNGKPTGRYHAAAEINRIVAAHTDLFLDVQPSPAQIAILHSQENGTVTVGQGVEEYLLKALEGTHKLMWEKGHRVEFVPHELITAETARGYKVILMPFMMYMPRATADMLKQFVHNGGTLIAFAKNAFLDDRGWVWNDRPGAGLDELFGVIEESLEVEKEIGMRVDPAQPIFAGVEQPTLKGYWHRQELRLLDDQAEVLAEFTVGGPAIVRHHFGAGQTFYFATHLDIALSEYNEPGTKQLFDNLLSLSGVTRAVSVRSADQKYVEERIDAHLLTAGRQHLIIVLNEGTSSAELEATVPDCSNVISVTNLYGGAAVAFTVENSVLKLSLTLAASDGALYLVDTK